MTGLYKNPLFTLL